jgi:hypothetical protein
MEKGNRISPPWNTASAREVVTPAILVVSSSPNKDRLGCEGIRMSRSLLDAAASATDKQGSPDPLVTAMIGPERRSA